jgi:isoquinoline 1-oxidoreductase beta subunit
MRRRTVLRWAVAGSGLLVTACADSPGIVGRRLLQRVRDGVLAGELRAPFAALLHLSADNVLTVTIPHCEMGQGIATAAAMLVADELDMPWPRVRIAFASEHRLLMTTAGSNAVSGSWLLWREIGATARELLLRAAAARWSVLPSELTAAAGGVSGAGGRAATFGELAAAAAALDDLGRFSLPPLRRRGPGSLVGTSPPRLDLPGKVDGSVRFGIDVRLPGMRYASARAALPGTRIADVEAVRTAFAASGAADAALLVEADLAAVVAPTWWRAERLLATLPVRFVTVPDPAAADPDAGPPPAPAIDPVDTAPAALRDGVLAARYSVPYAAHMTLEPANCSVLLDGEGCEIWLSTQSPERAVQAAAAASGLPVGRIRVRPQHVGGGFGRRTYPDIVGQAVRVARAVPGPVQLQWSREEDLRQDRFRPAFSGELRAPVDAGGQPRSVAITLHGQATGASGANATEGTESGHYRFGPLQATWQRATAPVQAGIWRSVGNLHNAFFLESFVDELAYAAGRDPLAYRQELLDDDGLLAAVTRVAELSDWARRRPAGCGQGIACWRAYGSAIALVVEVAPGEGGWPRPVRMTAVVDCGLVVHRSAAAAQVEGGALFGLSSALFEAATFEAGSVRQRNFHDYRLLRMADAPAVHVEFIASEAPPGGLGELATPVAAPALANALFAATGRRLRHLPLAPATGTEPAAG